MADLKPNTPPTLASGAPLGVVIGVAFGIFLFLLLPITQMISGDPSDGPTKVDMAVLPPPPAFDEINPPPPPEPEEEEVEELEKETPPMSLDMLELSMSADLSGMMGGDFVLPTIDAGQSLDDIIFEISDVDRRPEATVRIAPNIPEVIRKNKIDGRVVVEFVVRADGNVTNIRITETPHPALEGPVIRAIERWKFNPGEKDGEAVNVRVRQAIPIKIN